MPTLLLADDSLTIRRVIELTLADENITVVSVGDGDQAIERIEASPPDIVLVDTGMPGRSGYEIARYIKKTPRLAHIPVVLLTGAFEPIDQASIGGTGCDGVLAKPFEPQVVVARIRELLAGRGPAASTVVRDRPPARGAVRPPAGSADLDHYFDRLHAAFSGAPPAPPAEPPSAINLSPSTHKESAMTNPTPPLADAFAALLAAERHEPLSAVPSSWPGSGGASSAVIEEAARRVLEQLSDKTIRETVTQVVSQTAERLVREEIERIKASVK